MNDPLNANQAIEFDRLMDEVSRFGRRKQRMSRATRGEFLDLSGLTNRPALAVTRKILYMLLLLCVKDRASELHIEPGETETGEQALDVRYVIDGEPFDLVAPPAFVANALSESLKDLAGLRSPRGRIGGLLRSLANRIDGQPFGPASGGFRVGDGNHGIEIAATFHPGPFGDRIVLTISESDPALSNSIQRCLEELVATCG
jgi:type IV pilus assembly protein PilB